MKGASGLIPMTSVIQQRPRGYVRYPATGDAVMKPALEQGLPVILDVEVSCLDAVSRRGDASEDTDAPVPTPISQ